MDFFCYKNEFAPQNLVAPRVNNAANDKSQDQSNSLDLGSQEYIDKCNDLYFTAFTNFQKNNFELYFNVIRETVSFFDELTNSNYDIDLILPEVFNPDYNVCLINSLDAAQFKLNDIKEVLKLIYQISSFAGNFYHFRKSPLFDILYHLLQLKKPIVYFECILLINQYIVIFQTIQFPYDLHDFLLILKEISNYQNVVKYVAECLKLFIFYIDVTKQLSYILYLLDTILPNIKSKHGLIDIIESIIYITNADPLNYSLIFQTKIIHTFVFLFRHMFLNDFNKYHQIILKFFEFLRNSFSKIDPEWQENTIKIIGIDIFTVEYDDEKINLIIHQLLFNYLQHINIIEDNIFFSTILNRCFVQKLLQKFDEQAFEMKKQILIIINKLLKTQNQELFSQLTDGEANFLVICGDFAMSVSDDIRIQKAFLESIIDLVQVNEKKPEKERVAIYPIVEDYVSSCTESEDPDIQNLAFYFYNITTK